MTLGSSLHATAQALPHKTAFICGTEVVSYAELDRSAGQLAQWLLERGLQPGDRVAIHSGNSIQAVQLFYACFRAGLIAVPVNARLKALEMAYVLDHSGTKLCYTQPVLLPRAREAAANLAGLQLIGELPELSTAEPVPLPQVDENQPAVLIYTSGTTSRPKGVTHTHRTLLGAGGLMRQAGLLRDEKLLLMTSIMHASGLFFQMVPAVEQGITVILIPSFDAAVVLNELECHGATIFAALPALAQFVVAEQEERPRNVRSLRLAYAGGDSVPLALQARFQKAFGVPLLEIYGMTENGPTTCNIGADVRPGSLGRALGGVEGRVVDLHGNALADGTIGELAMRSPGVFKGYWNNPAETATTLVDGWLLTGDLVRRDSDGYYWFEGRRKQLIVRGGANISPQEVEEALYQHPAVFEVGVVGVPDPIYNERVAAFVSLKRGATASEGELRAFARERLSDHKVPEEITILLELPKGPTGKVLRRALREDALARTARA